METVLELRWKHENHSSQGEVGPPLSVGGPKDKKARDEPSGTPAFEGWLKQPGKEWQGGADKPGNPSVWESGGSCRVMEVLGGQELA